MAEESLAAQFVKQLISFQGSTCDAHDAHEREHAQLHSQNRDCNTISDLLGTQQPGGAIPKF